MDPYRLYYDPETNLIVDECGFIIFDIFRVVSPGVLLVFKARRSYMLAYGLNGEMIELFYMEEDING